MTKLVLSVKDVLHPWLRVEIQGMNLTRSLESFVCLKNVPPAYTNAQTKTLLKDNLCDKLYRAYQTKSCISVYLTLFFFCHEGYCVCLNFVLTVYYHLLSVYSHVCVIFTLKSQRRLCARSNLRN